MIVKIPQKDIDGFTLFAEGNLELNLFNKATNQTSLIFENNSVLILFYTFPNHRRAYVVYNCVSELLPKTKLPCVSSYVNILYKAQGKKIDSLKHILYLLKHSSSDYVSYPLLFYQKLCIIIETNKKITKRQLNILLKSFNLLEV